MKKYKVEIEGFTPVVYNRQTIELWKLIKALKKDQLEENEYKNWMMKAEVNNGNAILPPEWIIGCLVNSAKETRIVPWFATSKNQTYTKYISNMRIQIKPIPLGKAKELKRKEELMDSQGGKGGGKVLKCHPILEKWKASFEIIDTIGIPQKILTSNN